MTDKAQCHLAGLASLESVVEIAMHAVETHREFARNLPDDEHDWPF